ncbi:MAG TPA: sugar phosphate isomerase/epimerase family protein [Terriglobales bacterium]|nr:sugar phosphate isomerase/epimerase family protein [Terriglobales bacterium]
MLKAISTHVYVRERLHTGLLDGLLYAGAETIEIFGARGHFDYANRRSHVKEIGDWFRDKRIPLNSVHSPMYSDYEWGRRGSPPVNIAAVDKRARIDAMDEIKRAIEVAEQIPFRFLVQHVGISGEEWDPRKSEAAMTSIEHLKAFAKPLGVNVLLENIPNELSTPERLSELIRRAHFDDVGICFDVGHAHIMGGVAQAFEVLKPLIRSTHVHDNAGQSDDHMWPGDGTVNWERTMSLLRSAPQVPPLLLEIKGEGKTNIVEGMASAFRKLESQPAASGG